MKVVSQTELAPHIQSLVLHAPEIASEIQPGQFVNVQVPGDKSQIMRLPFTFARADQHLGTIELIYQVVGDGTRRLSQVSAGESLSVLAPLGSGWRIEKSDFARVLIVCGGLGLAPVLPLARALGHRGIEFDVALGAPSANRVVGVEHFLSYGAREVLVSTDDGTQGHHGFCTALSEKLLGENTYDLIATCGPEPMMRIVVRQAEEAGIACQVSMERGMICGFGVCMSCVVDTPRGRVCVCTEGPVFDAQEVIWDA